MNTEKDGCFVVAEAEVEAGTLDVVKDNKESSVYHVYQNTERVQPNHSAEGVMRYLMHVIHSISHTVSKLRKEKETLEKRVKLLTQLVSRFRTDGPDVDLITYTGDWEIIFPYMGGYTIRNKKKNINWTKYDTLDEVLMLIYESMD